MNLCALNITSTPFFDTTIITYDIELLPSGNKVGLILLDYEYFTIPHDIDTIQTLANFHQLSTQAKKYLLVVAINGDDPITYQFALD